LGVVTFQSEVGKKIQIKGANIMNIFELCRKFVFVLLLAFMAAVMLPACSSDSEEAPPPGESSAGGGEDCSKYSNQVDITECEIRNEILN
jgi:hypothetical protein